MSREASFGKTKLNNAREDSAVQVLLRASPCFQRPDAKTRKRILQLLDAADYSSRAFDLVETSKPLPPLTAENVERFISDIQLVEIKATKADIQDDNLHGFFFGATENEYKLAARLGERYRFAFVVLPPDRPPFHVLLTLAEVEARTKTKRIQFQVNLKGKPRP